MRDFTRMILVLFIVCGLSAGSLAVMNAITKDPIEKHEEETRQIALQEVFADAEKFDGGPVRAWVALSKGQESGHVFLTRKKGDSGLTTLVFGRDANGVTTGHQDLSDDKARLRDIEVDQEQLKKVFPNGEEFKPSALQGVWTALRNGKDVGRVFETLGQGYSGPITLMFGMDSSGAVTGLRVLSHTETPGLGAKITTAQFRDQFRNKRPEQLILKKYDPARGQIDAVTGATISSRAVTKALSTTLESFSREKAGGDK